MQLPTFLPIELSYCKEAKTPEEVLQTLLNHSKDDLILFFEVGCQHESWIENHGRELMRLLFLWLTDHFFHRRLTIEQIERIPLAVQGHDSVLNSIIPLDIQFQVQGESIPANSLLFGGTSVFFRELIWAEALGKNQKILTLTHTTLPLFMHVHNFILTGDLPKLWREQPEEILQLLHQATHWNIPSLANFTAGVYKRYLNRENVMISLAMANKENLPALQKECCFFINQQQYGVTFYERGPNELGIEIEDFTENAVKAISYTIQLLTHVSIRGEAALSNECVSFFKKKKKLIGLDLSTTPRIHEGLISFFPDVQELDLSSCSWLTDELFIQIVDKTPNLVKLKLVEDAQLTFRSIGALSLLKRLAAIDLSACRYLGDEELDLLASSCPKLIELSLRACPRITDKGVQLVAKRCPFLKIINQ